MGKLERDIKREVDAISLSVFLNRLAAEFEGAQNSPDNDLIGVAENLKKLEMKIKPYGGFYKLRLKVEQAKPSNRAPDGDDPPQANRSPEKYKTLKKRMKKTFKAIGDALDKNTLPASELVDEFSTDSRRMIAYDGYGDIHYDAYRKAFEQFREAFIANDFNAVRQQYGALDGLKKECHKAFK